MPNMLEELGVTKEELLKTVAVAGKLLEQEDHSDEASGTKGAGDDDRPLTLKDLEGFVISRKQANKTESVDAGDAVDTKRFAGADEVETTRDLGELKDFKIGKAVQYVLYGNRKGCELEADWIHGTGFNEDRVKDLNLESQIAGGFLVPTMVVNELIEGFKAQSVFRRMGSMILENAAKETTVPKKTGNSTAYWVGDAPTSDITESALTFGELALTLRNVAANVGIRKNLIKHSAMSVEQIVRTDIVEQFALAEDLAHLQGTGGTQPTGLKNWPGISSYTTGSIGTPDFDELIDARGALLARNVPVSETNSAWVMHPNVLTYLQKHKTGVGAYDYVVDLTMRPPDRILGLPVYTTSQIPINLGGGNDETYVFLIGVTRDYAIADGGTLEILVDPYTLAGKLSIRLIAVHEIDGGPRRVEGVQLLTGVKTA